jgi:hypothetical protein
MQRLRGVAQLGLADTVYPSATRSQFAHSLGALYVMGQMLRADSGKWPLLAPTRGTGLRFGHGRGPGKIRRQVSSIHIFGFPSAARISLAAKSCERLINPSTVSSGRRFMLQAGTR